MAARARAQTAQAEDAFDDLFDYDFDTTIPELDTDLNTTTTAKPATTSTRKVDLGVDEDIKVRKPRISVKLDAERLLSPQGLPKLRRTAPTLLGKKLKGKGHEYKDATRILNFYQLWADELYRKANFKDTITIIEKLGHTKRVQLARAQYLDEFTRREEPPEEVEKEDREDREAQVNGSTAGSEKIPVEELDDEELYAPGPPGPSMVGKDTGGGTLFLGEDGSEDDLFGGHPDEDELDALMASEPGVIVTDGSKTKTPAAANAPTESTEKPKNDEFGDEFEAIDDWDDLMDGMDTSFPKEGTTAADSSKSGDDGVAPGDRNETPSEGNSKSIFGSGKAKDVPEIDEQDELEALYGF